jgi:hypothetical protein
MTTSDRRGAMETGKTVHARLSKIFQSLRTSTLLMVIALMAVFFMSPGQCKAEEPATAGSTAETDLNQMSLTEINRMMTNPVTHLWFVVVQQNNYWLQNPHHWNSNLQLQPLLPVSLTKDWNLITRPVFQLFNSTPYPKLVVNPSRHRAQVEIDRTTGFGDTTLLEMLSPGPGIAGNWLLGLGPTFIFPTASTQWTGQGKYQAGPATVLGYLSKKWILGVFVQNWTSFAGSGSRADTNQMNLQPIAAYFLPNGWSIGYSGIMLANWQADSGNIWTVPVGLSVSKVVRLGRLPVKFSVAAQYMPIHPDSFGQHWNIQFQIIPVIPKLIKGTIL